MRSRTSATTPCPTTRSKPSRPETRSWLDHANAKAEVTRLECLQRAHDRSQHRLPQILDDAQQTEQRLTAQLAHVQAALDRRKPTAGDRFTMVIDGARYTDRGPAQEHLLTHLRRFQTESRLLSHGQRAELSKIAVLGDVELTATASRRIAEPFPVIEVSTHGVDVETVTVRGPDWDSDGHGVITRLENHVGKLDTILRRTETGLDQARGEIERSTAQLDKPFARADEIAGAQQKLAEIETEMAAAAAPEKPDTEVEAETPAPPTTGARLAIASSPVPIGEALRTSENGPAGTFRVYRREVHESDVER